MKLSQEILKLKEELTTKDKLIERMENTKGGIKRADQPVAINWKDLADGKYTVVSIIIYLQSKKKKAINGFFQPAKLAEKAIATPSSPTPAVASNSNSTSISLSTSTSSLTSTATATAQPSSPTASGPASPTAVDSTGKKLYLLFFIIVIIIIFLTYGIPMVKTATAKAWMSLGQTKLPLTRKDSV